MKKQSTRKSKQKSVAQEDFDSAFDQNKDISAYLDFDSAAVSKPQTQRVAIDVPEWMVLVIDSEAERIGLTRQALLKVWIAEKLEKKRVA